jgi:hypothetical protein
MVGETLTQDLTVPSGSNCFFPRSAPRVDAPFALHIQATLATLIRIPGR